MVPYPTVRNHTRPFCSIDARHPSQMNVRTKIRKMITWSKQDRQSSYRNDIFIVITIKQKMNHVMGCLQICKVIDIVILRLHPQQHHSPDILICSVRWFDQCPLVTGYLESFGMTSTKYSKRAIPCHGTVFNFNLWPIFRAPSEFNVIQQRLHFIRFWNMILLHCVYQQAEIDLIFLVVFSFLLISS